MNITVDVTTVEKNSSMNKKRTLMQSVTTQVQPSATLTMNEYNPYNLALGLYGEEMVSSQTATTLTDESYTVGSIPGIITLVDADGNRYMDVKDIVLKPSTTTAASATFATAVNGTLSTDSVTLTDTLGGTIALDASSYNQSGTQAVFYNISTAPTAAGDLDGLIVMFNVTASGATETYTAASGTTETFTLSNGVKVTFTVGTTDTFTAMGTATKGEFDVVGADDSYTKGKDYDYSDQDARAGIIRIKKGGKIADGDVVLVSATIPERTFVNVSLGDAGDIEGEFLFNGDPNVGTTYIIEGWKVKVQPDGDLSGLISDDFGSFQLTVRFMDDSENHADYPYARVTAVARADNDTTTKGSYDPEW